MPSPEYRAYKWATSFLKGWIILHLEMFYIQAFKEKFVYFENLLSCIFERSLDYFHAWAAHRAYDPCYDVWYMLVLRGRDNIHMRWNWTHTCGKFLRINKLIKIYDNTICIDKYPTSWYESRVSVGSKTRHTFRMNTMSSLVYRLYTIQSNSNYVIIILSVNIEEYTEKKNMG